MSEPSGMLESINGDDRDARVIRDGDRDARAIRDDDRKAVVNQGL